MWKIFSEGYLKQNRASGSSVRIAAFLSALFLSLLCGIFYNAWKYEVERVLLEDGGWHSRIIGAVSPEDIEVLKRFAYIREVVVREDGPGGAEIVELYFSDRGAVFSGTPQIAGHLGIPEERIEYNYQLLSLYLLRGPGDREPRLLFPLAILITLAASFSLIVIIHNSFAVSMNARVHQFGILASIGATPAQIRTCLVQEAAALCAIPVLLGILLGIAGSAGVLWLTNVVLGAGAAGRHETVFGYHPLVLLSTLLVTALTVWISAWLPARELSRLSPLEAIKNSGEYQLKRKKSARLLSLLFGIEGELAGNALRAQRKALRTATLSFLFSFLAFAMMQCFFSLSGISTRETYFERYQDVWDVMVSAGETDPDWFETAAAVRELAGVESAVSYQRTEAKRLVTEKELSGEMKALGGFDQAPGDQVERTDAGWLVNAPLVILDDQSFLAYCRQAGIAPGLDGAVVLNRIRDVSDPDFRHPVYVPYVKGEEKSSVLLQPGREDGAAGIPVLAYTGQLPALREEYATLNPYELVHFIPASLWKKTCGQLGDMESSGFICVKGRENVTLEELRAIQSEIDRTVGERYPITSENRIQEQEENVKMLRGMKAFLGGVCVLLALIGIGNVFSNTLGFMRQRKREFARYRSVGLTPGQVKKMFWVEALAVAGKPVLTGLPPVLFATGLMLRLSYVEPREFLTEAPVLPVFVFILFIWGAVALAYLLGWRSVQKISLPEVLRDDTML